MRAAVSSPHQAAGSVNRHGAAPAAYLCHSLPCPLPALPAYPLLPPPHPWLLPPQPAKCSRRWSGSTSMCRSHASAARGSTLSRGGSQRCCVPRSTVTTRSKRCTASWRRWETCARKQQLSEAGRQAPRSEQRSAAPGMLKSPASKKVCMHVHVRPGLHAAAAGVYPWLVMCRACTAPLHCEQERCFSPSPAGPPPLLRLPR